MDCGTLAAAVPDEMRHALHFFEHQGFLLQSETDGAAVLKMDISVPQR